MRGPGSLRALGYEAWEWGSGELYPGGRFSREPRLRIVSTARPSAFPRGAQACFLDHGWVSLGYIYVS